MNNFIAIFDENELRLPIKLDKDISIVDALDKKFSIYFQKIKIYQPTNETLLNDIRQIIDSVLIALKYTLMGQPSKAYIEMAQYGDKIIDSLNTIEYKASTRFYRIRSVQENYSLPRNELFHVPFQKRNKVAPQRFSVSGVPSLYLATACYTAWEELLRPDLNNIQIALLENKESFYVFDLRYSQFYNIKESVDKQNLLYIYPLIAACSVLVDRTKHADPFKVEYIIPQLLMQLFLIVDSIKPKGIVYSSSKIRATSHENSFDNIVLSSIMTKYYHTIDFKNANYSAELMGLFKMSNPISGGVVNFIKSFESKVGRNEYAIKDFMLDGTTLDYRDTDFALLEDFLIKKEIYDIEDFQNEQ